MAGIDRVRGLTLIELIVCTVIVGILSATALPVSRHIIRREKEEALQERLRDIREAIDRFRDQRKDADPARSEHDCYPKTLQDLVETKVLRRIPIDPMTGKPEWGVRSTTDASGVEFSDARNVFDVFSRSTETSTRGTSYQSW